MIQRALALPESFIRFCAILVKLLVFFFYVFFFVKYSNGVFIGINEQG